MYVREIPARGRGGLAAQVRYVYSYTYLCCVYGFSDCRLYNPFPATEICMAAHSAVVTARRPYSRRRGLSLREGSPEFMLKVKSSFF